jgi:hypothetical protein
LSAAKCFLNSQSLTFFMIGREIVRRCSRRDVMMARVLALKRQSSTDALAEEIPQS